MNPHDHFRLHAYVDGELTPDEVADVERQLARDPEARAEVATLRAQAHAMHARYDDLLTAPSNERLARFAHGDRGVRSWARGASRGLALAASIVVATGVGIAIGRAWHGSASASSLVANETRAADRAVEGRLQSFVQTAALSYAVFVPDVRHPVEVPAADETHLVAWLSKRLAAPLVVPYLGDAGWSLLGGRLLPAEAGPVAQFMYQDANGRRMTLAVSHGVVGTPADPAPATAFRIAEEHGDTTFYWVDRDCAYALTGPLPKGEMTALADRVYQQLDRGAQVPAR